MKTLKSSRLYSKHDLNCRGFNPYIVSSVHWLDDKRFLMDVSQFLEQERFQNGEISKYLLERNKKGALIQDEQASQGG